jgi:hypothetical protein
MYEVNLLPEEHFSLLAKVATGWPGFVQRPNDVSPAQNASLGRHSRAQSNLYTQSIY